MMAVGVAVSPESASRIFPPLLMKSRRSLGVRFGPSPASNQLETLPLFTERPTLRLCR